MFHFKCGTFPVLLLGSMHPDLNHMCSLYSKPDYFRYVVKLRDRYWDATEAPILVPAVRLESAVLACEIVPQWGAKIHSLTHKSTGAPLLLENPTHMPFNGAVRKPFASGGIEWNWGGGRGQIGHSVFTEQPAFVVRV